MDTGRSGQRTSGPGPIRRAGRVGRPRSGAGFTALEILVVVLIITLLVGFLVVAVGGLRSRAQEDATVSLLARLEAACKQYRGDWHSYPPDDFAEMGLSPPARHSQPDFDAEMGRTFIGAECLVLALGSRKLSGPYFPLSEKELCDKDQDGQRDARFTYWEFADGWGNPVRYEDRGPTVGVRFTSAGADMQFGTDDDLVRPKP